MFTNILPELIVAVQGRQYDGIGQRLNKVPIYFLNLILIYFRVSKLKNRFQGKLNLLINSN